MSKKEILRQSDELRCEDITACAEDDILALRIPAYYHVDIAPKVADRLIKHPDRQDYDIEPVGRVGLSYSEVMRDPQLTKDYYLNARHRMGNIRQACAPYLSPVDRFRLDLAVCWPAGARFEAIEPNCPMFAGLPRIFESGSTALPHNDILANELPHNPWVQTLQNQLAANIYLTQPEGGELAIWDIQLSPAEYNELRYRPDSYAVDPAKLPAPDLVIQPQIGDLIIFQSVKLHAVWTIKTGPRVTLSFFIGYRGPHEQLRYWS